VRPEGLEPPAYRFEACRSIQLSYGRPGFNLVKVAVVGKVGIGNLAHGGKKTST
jgi:hypothetical protein